MHPLDHIPLLARVFSHLTSEEIRDAAKVSKAWRDAGLEPVYWQVKSREIFATEPSPDKNPREDLMQRWNASRASLEALKTPVSRGLKLAPDLVKATASMALPHRRQLADLVLDRLAERVPANRVSYQMALGHIERALACVHATQHAAVQTRADEITQPYGQTRAAQTIRSSPSLPADGSRRLVVDRVQRRSIG